MAEAAWDHAGVEDRALVDAVLAGDREAFRLIVERFQGPVYRAGLRVLGSVADAEDVAQETFVTAFRSLGSYRGDGPLQAWLVRIATRTAFRRRSQRRQASDLAVATGLTSSAPDPLQSALADERAAAVRSAVAALDDPYREVVALRYFGELSLDEIATTTGRNLNTIKTQVRRGLQRLAGAIHPEALS
ncbi:MAG TPA: RNA polymerase sigma factor [Candidatus Limnocylindria bacterium]|jgi:RNA polymerase sigma-70 factor (ECF subfamily)